MLISVGRTLCTSVHVKIAFENSQLVRGKLHRPFSDFIFGVRHVYK